MAGVWLVVGLGNPGPRYAGTRHNVGYRVVDLLVERVGGSLRAHRSRRADVLETRFGVPGATGGAGDRVVLARPRSFMNDVGGPVGALCAFYKVPPEHVVAVHDELDLPFETVRLKLGGGDNGHNGLRSMRSALGSGDFHRVRLGVGRPVGAQPPADFLLSDYTAAERAVLPGQLELAADAVESLVAEGLGATQNRVHARGAPSA